VAAIALQRQKTEENYERDPRRSRGKIDSALERSPYIN
jgi:hypothetical protein